MLTKVPFIVLLHFRCWKVRGQCQNGKLFFGRNSASAIDSLIYLKWRPWSPSIVPVIPQHVEVERSQFRLFFLSVDPPPNAPQWSLHCRITFWRLKSRRFRSGMWKQWHRLKPHSTNRLFFLCLCMYSELCTSLFPWNKWKFMTNYAGFVFCVFVSFLFISIIYQTWQVLLRHFVICIAK